MKDKIDVLRGEFIGKEVKVHNKKVEGRIIDETKNSFLINTKNDGRKRLLKINQTFQLKVRNYLVDVDGNSILMKPEDRIKIKKWK